jgi:hypothetical protein
MGVMDTKVIVGLIRRLFLTTPAAAGEEAAFNPYLESGLYTRPPPPSREVGKSPRDFGPWASCSALFQRVSCFSPRKSLILFITTILVLAIECLTVSYREGRALVSGSLRAELYSILYIFRWCRSETNYLSFYIRNRNAPIESPYYPTNLLRPLMCYIKNPSAISPQKQLD